MKAEISQQENWSLVIRSQRGWLDLRLGELWRARELILLFVWRDFVSTYKQTILGPLWHLVGPVTSALVFTVVFGKIAKLPTDGLPTFLFYFSGQTIWGYFSSCVMGTSNTLVSNKGIYGKVYFHRLSIPVSVIISRLISFGIRFSMFIAFVIYFMLAGADVQLTPWALLTPVLLLIVAGIGVGFGLIFSSLTTKYRDLQNLLGFVMQILMYGTPLIYPLTLVPEKWRILILANPITAVIEVFRLGFLGTSSIGPEYLLYSASFMLVVIFLGVLIFNRVETTFLDTV